MMLLDQIRTQLAAIPPEVWEYEVQANLDLYDSPMLTVLATQAGTGRHLAFQPEPTLAEQPQALAIRLWEDDYPAWLRVSDLELLQLAREPHQPPNPSRAEIQVCIPQVLAFAFAAMAQPNTYLWGGTVGPNYDCSGLVQHAFAAQGIWLPRDAYQQEAFTQPIAQLGDRPEEWLLLLEPGDLIFFGPPAKATHVAIFLGEDEYIHSSGKDQGRNGIGVDRLSPGGDLISQTYYEQVRGAGRVVKSYQPTGGGDRP